MELVILLPTVDTLRDFHGAPPVMDFSLCYHRVIISTTNFLANQDSVMARYSPLLEVQIYPKILGGWLVASFL